MVDRYLISINWIFMVKVKAKNKDILHVNPQLANPIIRTKKPSISKHFSQIAKLHRIDINPTSAAISGQHRNADIYVISNWHIQLGFVDVQIRYLSHFECSTSFRKQHAIVQTSELYHISINPTPVAISSQHRNANMEIISKWHICLGFADVDIYPPLSRTDFELREMPWGCWNWWDTLLWAANFNDFCIYLVPWRQGAVEGAHMSIILLIVTKWLCNFVWL